jgi:hypothetical protein
MNFGWETKTERLKRHMSIPPKKKLELLYEINRFTNKYSIKKSPLDKKSSIAHVANI